MTWNISVTRENVEQMSDVADSLRAHLDQLIDDVQEYPLEIYFEGYRVFFEDEADVHNFIQWLEGRVESVRHAA